MNIIAVPISLESISDEHFECDLHKYLDYFKRGRIERVFIALLQSMCTSEVDRVISSDKFAKTLSFFKENGLQTGVWIGGFGHGSLLEHAGKEATRRPYTKCAGVLGEAFEYGYCPSDEDFVADYLNAVKMIAEHAPDIIMLDDDFRLNGRAYHMGCFCERHLNEFRKAVGEDVKREDIEKLVFEGGPNKYRDAYMDMSARTLSDFARKVRAKVDEVDPSIRVGTCMTPFTWDLEGTDGITLARIFAGNTKPFMRAFGAPYHNAACPIEAIEHERMQHSWVKDSCDDIEVFCEGDVYPRPSYNVPAKALELFDLALYCSGNNDGCLKYMFCYEFNVAYEDAYIKAHIADLETKEKIGKLFSGKKMTGIPVFAAMHKIRDSVYHGPLGDTANLHTWRYKSFSSNLLSKNGIPTCYGSEQNEYPTLVCGESARHIPLERLNKGAILDCEAALILRERGIDTGILNVEKVDDIESEYYVKADEKVGSIWMPLKNKITCNDKAVVSSTLLPHGTPGAYVYENDDGMRFFVLAADLGDTPEVGGFGGSNYFNNYHRREQIVDAIEYISGKKLPAVNMKNPNLYILTAKGEGSMSVLLINMFSDDAADMVVKLDREYKTVRFAKGDGRLVGENIEISAIGPYGFAAFEVME